MNAERKAGMERERAREISDVPATRHLGHFALKAEDTALVAAGDMALLQAPSGLRFSLHGLFSSLVYARAMAPARSSGPSKTCCPRWRAWTHPSPWTSSETSSHIWATSTTRSSRSTMRTWMPSSATTCPWPTSIAQTSTSRSTARTPSEGRAPPRSTGRSRQSRWGFFSMRTASRWP